jgi:adenylylsulfate reductase, subunit A
VAEFELETDVLVVGGGIAGCVAAARAREAGADVVIVDKARSIRRTGDAGHGLGFVTIFLDAEPGDSAEDFTNWYMRVADGLVPRNVVMAAAVDPMHDSFAYADSLCLSIRDPAAGGYRRVARPWAAGGPRIVQFPGDNVKPILAEAAEKAGARVVGGVHATGILRDRDGAVAGLVGVGVRDGAVRAFRGRTVIVATGSAERVIQTPSP